MDNAVQYSTVEVDGIFSRFQCIWQPSLVALVKRRPQLRSLLLSGAVDRILTEGVLTVRNWKSTLRLGLLQRWAIEFLCRDDADWPDCKYPVDIAERDAEVEASNASSMCARSKFVVHGSAGALQEPSKTGQRI